MFDNQKTRQELYDRIRESSKAEVVLQEMKRLGFWSKNDKEPSLPEQLIKQEAALVKELNALNAQKRKFHNKEAMLREMRIKRMATSKEKREENKNKREQQRFEKAAAGRQRKTGETLYLGLMMPAEPANTPNDTAKLTAFNLPVFNNE